MEWLNQIYAWTGKIGIIGTSIFGAWKAYQKWVKPLVAWSKNQFSLVKKTDVQDGRIEAIEIELATIRKLTGTAIFKAEAETGYITEVNIAWSDIFGMSEDEARGNNWHKTFKESNKVKKAWDSNLKSHSLFDEDFVIINQESGKEISINCKAIALINKKGKPISVIGVVKKY